MSAPTERTVAVTCAACGAQSMTLRTELESPTRKRVTLACSCGEVVDDEYLERTEVRAIVCGIGEGSSVVVGSVWGRA